MADDLQGRMNSRDFDVGEDKAMIELIRMILREAKQFAAIPLPESISDTRHTGWRISWPRG